MPLKDTRTFTIPFLQVLGEDGKVDPKLDPKLGDDQLLKLYRGMVLGREADQRMLKLQRQGRTRHLQPVDGPGGRVVRSRCSP